MAKDIFDSYPSSKSQGGMRASNGGVMPEKDVMGYKPPTGIKNQTRGPGLGQDNYGNCGTQGKYSTGAGSSGMPGLGGENLNTSGTQGKR
jgi:hypothetical protein